MQNNPFDEHWRECLLAHYLHVTMVNDTQNELSLHRVLLDIGVTEAELAHIRVESLSEKPAQGSIEGEDMPNYKVDPEVEREAFARLEAQLVSMVDSPAPSTAPEKAESESLPVIDLPDFLGISRDPLAVDPAPTPEPESQPEALSKPPEDPEPPVLSQLSLF